MGIVFIPFFLGYGIFRVKIGLDVFAAARNASETVTCVTPARAAMSRWVMVLSASRTILFNESHRAFDDREESRIETHRNILTASTKLTSDRTYYEKNSHFL
jgi:hypothetical protein